MCSGRGPCIIPIGESFPIQAGRKILRARRTRAVVGTKFFIKGLVFPKDKDHIVDMAVNKPGGDFILRCQLRALHPGKAIIG